MSKSTLSNLIWTAVWLILGLSAIVAAIYCNAIHQYFLAVACFLFSRICYTDNEYGTESVKSYFKRTKK